MPDLLSSSIFLTLTKIDHHRACEIHGEQRTGLKVQFTVWTETRYEDSYRLCILGLSLASPSTTFGTPVQGLRAERLEISSSVQNVAARHAWVWNVTSVKTALLLRENPGSEEPFSTRYSYNNR